MTIGLFVADSPPVIPKKFLFLEQQKIIIVDLHQTIDKDVPLEIFTVELVRVTLCTEVRTFKGRKVEV